MRIATVVGARPQFVKAGAVSRVLRVHHDEVLIHTGQHYDAQMSQVFFDELHLPEADYNLHVGSGSHATQTARMLERLEAVLESEHPDLVLVYGDTNSTLAAALAAVKLHLPIAHVEAGLRSFNLHMPEEVNRRLTDHISTLLFTPSERATVQLASEGLCCGIHQVGDVMYDVLRAQLAAAQHSDILTSLGLKPHEYLLATIHRAENTDDPERLAALLQALGTLERPVVFPVHPRTRHRIEQFSFEALLSPTVRCIEPVGYLDMLMLEQHAARILTDSGGVQKEAYLLRVPCITLRGETEWTETVDAGWNRLVPMQATDIPKALQDYTPPYEHPDFYGDGHSAERIAAVLDEFVRV